MAPDYKRFLIVLTNKRGNPEIIFSCDHEEEADTAYLKALDAYEEEIKSGLLRVDQYRSY